MARADWDGLKIALHDDVYEPGDDTWMLARVVQRHVGAGDRFLEVGCGTGLVALAAARLGAVCTATDRNPFAVRTAARNAAANRLPLDVVQTDLLAGLCGPFDVVAFNPPYLPTAEHEHLPGPLDWAFDGGPDGNVVVRRFVAQVEGLVARGHGPRELLVVHSSIADTTVLEQGLARLGYGCTVEETGRFFYESITVRRFAGRGRPGVAVPSGNGSG